MGNKLVPDYEVKLLMKPEEVLDSDGKLKDSVKSEFKTKSGSTKMSIQFVDTDKQTIYTSGWNLRVRKSEGDDTFGLTYKRRFPINVSNNTDPAANIDVAVSAAQKEGFDSSSPFEAQVEVGYKQQTLSISHNQEVSDKGYDGMDLPHAKDSCNFLTEQQPQSFKSSSVSTQSSGSGGPLTNGIVYGPVHAKRYKGTWNNEKLYIEVWPIRTSKTDGTLVPTVEASFKTADTKKAMEGRDKLAAHLDMKGWFLPEDSLKTKLIMDRYGKS